MAINKEYIERFSREQQASDKLMHPNIVATLDQGLIRGVQFIAMEYVEGETLSARLKREGKLPEKEALRITIEVAKALDHAHKLGWVHRDIKPDNILLGSDGKTVKVADLGLAKSVFGDAGLTRTGQIVGTPYYIAPEQARGDKSLDPRSDLYSLGCTLYHLLTGSLPFHAPSPMEVLRMHLEGALPNPLDINPQLSEHSVKIVVKLLAKEPMERYESAGQLVQDLERAQRGEEPMYAGLDAQRSSVLPPDPNRKAKLEAMARAAAKAGAMSAGQPGSSGQKKGCLGMLFLVAVPLVWVGMRMLRE